MSPWRVSWLGSDTGLDLGPDIVIEFGLGLCPRLGLGTMPRPPWSEGHNRRALCDSLTNSTGRTPGRYWPRLGGDTTAKALGDVSWSLTTTYDPLVCCTINLLGRYTDVDQAGSIVPARIQIGNWSAFLDGAGREDTAPQSTDDIAVWICGEGMMAA